MKKFILAIAILTSVPGFGQKMEMEGTEVGIDGFFGASTFGGSFGVGLKYGFKFGEHLIVGPSIRYQRYWMKNVTAGTEGGYNCWGGGVFAHARFVNALFAGLEIDLMRSPFNSYGAISGNGTLAPCVFIGGGFSREFNESVRINAGLYYDVVNHVNSPFRQGYFMKRANGTYIPAIYRISFFFPLS